ncbi:hypothetical protein, partial [Mesorhizobium sp. Cs1321R2N1]|uniref:hypothetical protein n=1 Tax=Mesorhizobium sp. Cs1321R2N1 TaxID=3015174 RepID=UPI00301BDA10
RSRGTAAGDAFSKLRHAGMRNQLPPSRETKAHVVAAGEHQTWRSNNRSIDGASTLRTMSCSESVILDMLLDC